MSLGSALTGLEPALRLVDDVDTALAAHDTAIAMPALERAERVLDLHWSSPCHGGARGAWLLFGPFGPVNGGHDWDRTSDPYDVNVVLYR